MEDGRIFAGTLRDRMVCLEITDLLNGLVAGALRAKPAALNDLAADIFVVFGL